MCELAALGMIGVVLWRLAFPAPDRGWAAFQAAAKQRLERAELDADHGAQLGRAALDRVRALEARVDALEGRADGG